MLTDILLHVLTILLVTTAFVVVRTILFERRRGAVPRL